MKYWSKAEYYEYLVQYANHFKLHSHIRFETTVKHAKLDKSTGKWEVTMMSVKEKTPRKEDFDYVVVATGANHTPSIPSVFDGFKGEVLHSSEYHTAEQVRGKKVLVVGTGESATDVAHSASKVAENCTVWGRRYLDMAPRFILDLVEDPNYDELARLKKKDDKLLPNNTLEILTTSRMVRNLPLGVWSSSLFGLCRYISSKHGPNSPQSVICDVDTTAWGEDYWSSDTFIVPTKSAIMGTSAARGELDITIAPKISCKETTITFHNPSFSKNKFTSASTVDKDVDVVVACTGYKAIGLDKWLDTPESIESNPRLWFKKCFPPKMGNNIAFLGYARPHSGGIPQCSEILARYIAQILIGSLHLPQNYEDIAKADGECESECYHGTPHNKLVVDYHAFMMSVARLIGCTPNMPYNPIQIVKYWTFPLWPCFFRTKGPGVNMEACDSVVNKFGPFDALAPMPFLAIEVLFTFLMPFMNAFSYCFGWIIDIGKKGTLPRGYRWRMSKFHFMYSNIGVLDFEDLKFAGGQFIAGVLVFLYMVMSILKSIVSMPMRSMKKAKEL